MKKYIAYLVALTCCFSGTATFSGNYSRITAYAETEKTYEDLFYIVYDRLEGICDTPCIEITGLTQSQQQEIYIPSTIDGLPVVSISGDTFSENETYWIYIPSSIKHFGEGIFNNLSNCIVIIDDKFEFNMNTVSDSQNNPVSKTFSLNYVYPPADDENGNKVIEDIEIPETVCGLPVTSVGFMAFADNQNIRSVKIPDTVSYFDRLVFQNSSLEYVNIPKSLKVIPSNTFKNCKKLKSVEFHENVVVAKNAFENIDFTIPDNVKVSESNSSDSYSGIVKKYGDFDISITGDKMTNSYYCTVVSYNPDSLSEKPVDIIFPESFLEIPVISVDRNFWTELCDNGTNVNSISFSSGINDINFIKLNNPENLKSVIFKSNDIKLGQGIFKNTSISEISINGSCTIENEVFKGCKKLKKVTFNGSKPVITIGHDAFSNCSSLETVVFPENMTADFQVNAFGYCPAITELTLNGKINATSHAFRECDNLKKLTLNGDITLNTDAFSGCDSLSDITLNTDNAINGSAFNNCPNLLNINSVPVFNTDKGTFNAEINDFVFSNFNNADDIGFINLYITEQANKFVEKYITDDMSDMQKIKTVHDWVCANTSYDSDDVSDRKNHNDASVFMNGKSVCEGYARCYNILLNASGIETYYLLSDNHAWNVVKLGGHYFHSDTTWDDGDIVNYDWFLKSDSEVLAETEYHSVWNFRTPSTLHNFQKETLPECSYSMGDINTDGSISIADLVTLNKYLTGRSPVSADDIVLADLTFDGVTDVFDLVRMRQLLLEK